MIKFKQVSKEYGGGSNLVKALNSISFDIKEGEFTIILGPSGSGKSTLLNILGGMDRLTNGQFVYGESDISNLDDNELSEYRKDVVGFIFQFYNLIPSLTANENVAIAAALNGHEADSERLLASVGLKHRLDNFPNQLSGGEMQRVSIARALAKRPKLLLCDEPTGALDSETGLRILELLQDAAKGDTAVVMVTHNEEFIQYADCVIRLSDGEIESISRNNDRISKMGGA